MRRFLNKLILPVLCAALLWAAVVPAWAHEVPDLKKTGSITLTLQYDGKALSGGSFALYRVGTVTEKGGDYSFSTAGTGFSAFSGSLDKLDAALAQKLKDYADSQKIKPVASAKNSGGKAVFSQVTPGLYLVVQTQRCSGYEPLSPFLVSVPMNEDGHYRYDIDAAGKFKPTPEPSNPNTPDKPSTPDKPGNRLPQTGQLNWPVPVLAGTGLVLFALGWWLCFGQRKKRHEA